MHHPHPVFAGENGVVSTITTTTRLEVRQLVPSDAAFLFDLHSQPAVTGPLAMQPSRGIPEELQRMERFTSLFGDALDFGIWGLALLDGPLIGLVLLKPLRPLGDHDGFEVGWRLHPDSWGNGYATEAGSGLVELAFGPRRLTEVFAVIEPSNDRSHAVAHRLGMDKIGTLEYAGMSHDLLSIQADQWRSLQ
jgi:RimJ/RimL family protein N-acetyltransferase